MRIIAAQIEMFSEQDGGRHSYFTAGYSPHLVTHGTDFLLAVRVKSEHEVYPGASSNVTLELIYHPNVSYATLKPGSTFYIREGPNTVGTGVVLAHQNS